MRIITANVNGIRSAYKKGFLDYIAQSQADIICLQELKAQEADLSPEMQAPHGMHGVWHCAQTLGYSRAAIYIKRPPHQVQLTYCQAEFATAGRYLPAEYAHARV